MMCQDVNYKKENAKKKRKEYRIYSIKHPGHLLNVCTLRVGAYLRWALIRGWVLIRGWALVKFSPFSASSKFILQQTINNKKT